ncbi:MAG: chemoreceptor glutamine deamidase CheD [Candidatus Tectimicrobiota bacterium]
MGLTSHTLPKALPGFEQINRYWDPVNHMFAAKILPGEYYVTVENEMIVTVLGSCVSACVRDPIYGIGGMNHFMLPAGHREGSDPWGNNGMGDAARYGNYAMELLINAILKFGGSRANLEVKITGGGKILRHMTDVGERNIAFVREYIRTEGLRLLAEDVGDIYPRKVYYLPMPGKVRLQKLRAVRNDTIIRREQDYMHHLVAQPARSEVELF